MNTTRTVGSAHPVALPSLTGLRWIAAFFVFAYHLRNLGYFSGPAQDALTQIFGAGATAVSVFFILSGFVLAWSHRPGESVAASWWRRLVRIYPLHLVGVLLAVVTGASVYPAIRTTDPAALWANIFLVSSWREEWWQAGNPVSWSLCCEAFFYLLAPFFTRMLARQHVVVLAAVGMLAVVTVWALPFIGADLFPEISAYSNPVMRLPEFILGLIAGMAMRRRHWSGPRLSIALPVLIAGYAASLSVPDSPLAPAAFTSLGAVLTITALARRDLNGHRSILSRRTSQLLGKASFSFYLVHLLTLDAVQGLVPSLHQGSFPIALLGATGALTIAVGLSIVLHLGIEAPIASAARPHRSRHQGAPLTTTSSIGG